ncbi:plasmid pRiA4b ORF-3 family protein [Alkalihalobacillus sp. MEB130]|uniref:plasmid pRiA4b ORF-3 family protein n=1 Tax=Alkalihalobacillus sp. MEB130 TaxID=2976704 RepID=UPI0028DDE78E|nr:plasmid pRiA4b ORF-3 family protein [Alkalihalobacillus sp. MEB130]MDT8858872.1 plasmid pRiA4b ORF-3 family protein [Alkalihalobacillus sp. MEB130]
MLIQCTKKLLTELKMKPSPPTEEEELFSWHANIVTVARRKTLVFMNNSNRYVIIIHGVKGKDLKKMDELLLQAIRETFHEENIKDEVAEAFLSQAKAQEFTFSTTKDRTSVARLNKACENPLIFERDLNPDSHYQAPVSKRASRFLVGNGKNDYIVPSDLFFRDIEEWYGASIFNSEALVLRITLGMGNHHVWRKIVVPKQISFVDLHETIQIAFDWHDSHLHEFRVFVQKPFDPMNRQQEEDKRKPIVTLVCTEEALSYVNDVPMKMETYEKLADYLPAEVTYYYDFGDNWAHHIIVEEMINDYDQNYPVCLAGEGNAPPEDVGGEPGYEEFLAILADRTHPDHAEMRDWGISQGYKDFDVEYVSRRMKRM